MRKSEAVRVNFAATVEVLQAARGQPRLHRYPDWANGDLKEIQGDPELGSLLERYIEFETKGEMQGALEVGQKILAKLPENTEALRYTGGCLIEIGRVNESVPLLRKATELSPELGVHWKNLGLALMKQDRLSEALEVVERRRRGDTGQIGVHLLYAYLLAETGELARAEALVTEVDEATEDKVTLERILEEFGSD